MSEHKWAGVTDDGPWTIEASYDCFTESEPFVVDVWINFDTTDGPGAFLSPTQAREMAAALLTLADDADAANRQEAHRDGG